MTAETPFQSERDLEIIPAHDVPLATQAKIFSRAFAGYVGGSFEMEAAGLARFVSLQGADLCYSRFAQTPEGLAGFAYINRTANVSRIGGMGVIGDLILKAVPGLKRHLRKPVTAALSR